MKNHRTFRPETLRLRGTKTDWFRNCPKNVDPELCFEFCRTMTCWEYPNNWPKLNPKIDELLTRSRRGAELTREGLRTGSIDLNRIFVIYVVLPVKNRKKLIISP